MGIFFLLFACLLGGVGFFWFCLVFFFLPFLKCSWSNIFLVRLLCGRVRTLRVHSLAVVSNRSSTEVLISYPEKLLTIGLEILFLEKWKQF